MCIPSPLELFIVPPVEQAVFPDIVPIPTGVESLTIWYFKPDATFVSWPPMFIEIKILFEDEDGVIEELIPVIST